MSGAAGGQVRILLSTYNGAAFLRDQLASFVAQTYPAWTLLWRDDGSTDATVAIMEQFAATHGPRRCARLRVPEGNLGASESFLALLRAALPTLGAVDAAAFADQDDVWLPEKLARGMAALALAPPGLPALVCSRQVLVDARLRPFGESPPLRHPPGFPAALAQNVATGCTILLNRPAAALIAGSTPPQPFYHDWWSYLVVAAAGGDVRMDATPLVLYRQHGANTVGAPASVLRRAQLAWRRGSGTFMALLRGHLAALAAQPALLSAAAQADVAHLQAALAGGWPQRLRALRMPGLRRQTFLETLTFRLWFLLG